MIPYVYKRPIHNIIFKHVIVGYEDTLFCSNCNDIIPNYAIKKKQKTCPNCRVKIQWDKEFTIKYK